MLQSDLNLFLILEWSYLGNHISENSDVHARQKYIDNLAFFNYNQDFPIFDMWFCKRPLSGLHGLPDPYEMPRTWSLLVIPYDSYQFNTNFV